MPAVHTYFGPRGPEDKTEAFDAESFLGFLRRSHPIWQPEDPSLDYQPWVFRGHRDANWDLVPSAARPKGNPLGPVIEKYREVLDQAWRNSPEHKRNMFAHLLAQARAVSEFVRLGSEMGSIDLPDSTRLLLSYDLGPHNDTNPFLGDYNSQLSRPDSFVQALAQHHEIPTFLLDWSENPWYAAHFASLRPKPKSWNENPPNPSDICVWALKVDEVLKRANFCDFGTKHIGTLNVFRADRSRNQYLATQAGLFTFLSNDWGHWSRTGNYLKLDEFLEKIIQTQQGFSDQEKMDWPSAEGILRKVVLSHEHIPELRRLLLLERITPAHLMPTLDNLAETSKSVVLDSTMDKLDN